MTAPAVPVTTWRRRGLATRRTTPLGPMLDDAADRHWSAPAGPTCTSPSGIAPMHARPRRPRRRSPGTAPLTATDTEALVRSILTEAQWEQVRARPGVRPRLHDPGRQPLPGQRLPPARLRTARRSGPSRTRSARWTSSALPAVGRATSPACPVAWCWSPARPARARRRRWPACSTWPTARARPTSSPSRTRSSSCTRTRSAWSTSARSASDTDDFADRAQARRCARTPTSSWSASCVTSRPTSTALTAAETGHLVLATLHTQSRGPDDRPPHRHLPAAPAAADPGPAGRPALQGVVTQALAPRADGSGRTVVMRDHVGDAGDPQPDPRGQDPPDPVVHAVLGATWA